MCPTHLKESTHQSDIKLLVGREEEQQTLIALLGKNTPVTPCMVLTGPSGCGKSLLVHNTLSQLEQLHGQKWVVISCSESFCSTGQSGALSSKLLFNLIIYSIKSRCFRSSNRTDYCLKDGSTANFVDTLCFILQALAKENADNKVSLILVFDQAEKLRDADQLLLPLLVHLGSIIQQQLARMDQLNAHLITLLLTRSPWEKYSSGTFHLEPTIIHLDNYSRDNLLRILMLNAPDTVLSSRYQRFIDLLLTVCLPVCRNVGELNQLAKINWPAFEEPVLKGQVAPDDEWGQWKLAQPTLKRSLNAVYLRAHSSSTSSTEHSALELPFYARFLLVAAFLASYNPSDADKKFLVRNTGKQTSRMKRKEKKAHSSNALLHGPRLFHLDRLFAIFYAILRDQSERVSSTVWLTSQVACLTAIGLFAPSGPAQAVGGLHTTGIGSAFGAGVELSVDPLANPRYRCLMNFETAKRIAQSVDFDLASYLKDFTGVC